MENGQRGRFLAEMGLLTAIVAVLAVVVASRMQSPLQANERLAINTLHNVARAQKALRNLCAIDCDANGSGEFGFFGELLGTDALRNDQVGGVGTMRLQPPLLSRLGRVRASRVSNHSYLFQMYLPDTASAGVSENASGGAAGCCIDAHKAERLWCCYAWPTVYGTSGKRVFFVNEAGYVLASDNTIMNYGGGACVPQFSAAFEATTSGFLDCRTAANTVGVDGQRWKLVN